MESTAAPRTGSRLIGVGVGPGDPGLITLRAVDVLARAARIVAPSIDAETTGRAESIVVAACPEVRVERVVIAMGPDPSDTYRRAAREIARWLDEGGDVAFVTIGDPNIYSTFTALCATVLDIRPGTEVETVPGIMAFQALAASMHTTVVGGTETLTLVTALEGTDDIVSALDDSARAVVVYKGGARLPEIASEILARGRDAVIGEMLGLEGENIGRLGDVEPVPSSYLSTVIVPPSRSSSGNPAHP